jgi:hypothetical protein
LEKGKRDPDMAAFRKDPIKVKAEELEDEADVPAVGEGID